MMVQLAVQVAGDAESIGRHMDIKVHVVFGGLDSVLGALVGGLLVGWLETVAGALWGGEYKMLAIFTLLTFALVRLIPGDPIELMAGERGIEPERHAQLRAEMGLDDPLLVPQDEAADALGGPALEVLPGRSGPANEAASSASGEDGQQLKSGRRRPSLSTRNKVWSR